MTWQIIWQLEAKGIAIMGLATLLAWFLRRSTGARRHAVWVASLVAVAFLPLLQVKGPELPSPTAKPLVLAATLLSGPISLSEAASIPKPKTGPARTVRYAAGSLAPVALPSKAPQLFALLWLAASLLLFCRLIWGTLRARAMLVGAATILSPKGCRVMAVDSPVPATIGWFRPIIMLPKASFGWPSEKTEAVLGHELAHVRRKDWLWQCMSQVVCAVFWFNPLVWYAAARFEPKANWQPMIWLFWKATIPRITPRPFWLLPARRSDPLVSWPRFAWRGHRKSRAGSSRFSIRIANGVLYR